MKYHSAAVFLFFSPSSGGFGWRKAFLLAVCVCVGRAVADEWLQFLVFSIYAMLCSSAQKGFLWLSLPSIVVLFSSTPFLFFLFVHPRPTHIPHACLLLLFLLAFGFSGKSMRSPCVRLPHCCSQTVTCTKTQKHPPTHPKPPRRLLRPPPEAQTTRPAPPNTPTQTTRTSTTHN